MPDAVTEKVTGLVRQIACESGFATMRGSVLTTSWELEEMTGAGMQVPPTTTE